MDWTSVGKLIGPMAPTLGGILGGFIPIPGGSMIGEMAGKMVAGALGVDPTPEAVGNAIQNDPSAAAKLSAAETEAATKWPALAEIAKARYAANATEAETINQTMRQELAAGQKWFAWRNLYGYSVGIEATATSWVILYALVFNPSIYKNVADSLSFFLSWYGMRFGLLGYIHNGASNEKIAAVTGEAPSVVKNIVAAVTGKKR
jgi:hypothetical protein